MQYLVFNLGMSPGFQHQDFKHMQFPAQMLIDYVRVYQPSGVKNGMTCDPPDRPTANYIEQYVVRLCLFPALTPPPQAHRGVLEPQFDDVGAGGVYVPPQ
jgi:hypothetical protein